MPTRVLDEQVTVKGAGTGAVARTLQDKARDVVSVKDFGAVGDGSTDDTTAIQAAINFASAVAGKPIQVYAPAGDYKVSASLTFYDQAGVSFIGAGAGTTRFSPTTALAGLPVFLVRNVRDSVFRGFLINGVPSGAGAHGIEIRSEAAGPNSYISTGNKFDDITIGGTSVGIADGVRITDTVDVNNDKHEFTRSVRVRNFTGNGFYIGHSNALWEKIHAAIDGGPVAIWVFAGSADINAVFGPLLTDTEVKVGGGGGFGKHPITVSGNSEQNAANTVKLLSVSDASVEVRYDNYERYGGATSATNVIDWTGTGGYLQIVGSRFHLGQPNNKLNITGAGTNATIIGSRLGFDLVDYVGRMNYALNTWIPGTVTETEVGGGTGTFEHIGDYGAQFTTTPTQCSAGVRWALGPSGGYFSSTGTVLTLTGEDLNLATTTKGVQTDSYSSSASGNPVTIKGRVATNQTKTGVKKCAR
jgi:hypothetical protein